MEITDKHFKDWESETFGFGYGTGEEFTLKALRLFFRICCGANGSCPKYNYKDLERAMNPMSVWLLINTLCHADVIEYGCSPRNGWLTSKGILLKNYIENKSLDDLYELTMLDYENDGFVCCSKSYCNCEKGNECNNPLFK